MPPSGRAPVTLDLTPARGVAASADLHFNCNVQPALFCASAKGFSQFDKILSPRDSIVIRDESKNVPTLSRVAQVCIRETPREMLSQFFFSVQRTD